MNKIVYTFLVAISLSPLFANATTTDAGQYTLLEPLPCIAGVSTNCNANNMQTSIDISSYLLYVYKFGLAASVFLAIVMIIWGGFEYILSATPFGKSDGKGRIEKAVFGLVMVLVSYLILQTIDPRLVYVDSKIPTIRVNSAELESFTDAQNELASNLKSMSAIDQAKVSSTNAEILNLIKEKSDILADKENNKLTQEESKAKIDSVNAKISEKSVDNLMLTAEAVGSQGYANSIKKMSGNSARLPQNLLDVDIMILEAQYNAVISQVNATNNASSDKVTKLINQKKFYSNQMKEDLILHNLINSSNDKQTLVKKVDSYKADLNDPNKIKNSGISQEKYQEIYNAKISTLESLVKLK